MKLSSLLSPQHIVVGMQSTCMHDAVRELFEKVGDFTPNVPVEELFEHVMRREQQGSTALECGIAIPHARVSELDDFFILIGKTRNFLAERGQDDVPIDLLFVILANDKKNSLLLQTMAAIGMMAQQQELLTKLRQASTAQEVWDLIDQSGINVKRVIHAGDLMRKSFLQVYPDSPVQHLLDLMFEFNTSVAVVTDMSGAVIGYVTSAEILEAALPPYMSRLPGLGFLEEFEPFEQFFKRESNMPVRDIMNRRPLIVDADSPIIQVAFKMNHQKSRFAFVQEHGKLAGIIDRDDLLNKVLRA